jgi:hypothetical protein
MRRPDIPARALLRALARGELYRGAGDRFVKTAPTFQTAVDSVPVAWASRLPLADVSAGQVELFDDARVTWAIEALGGVDGAACIELGPLEGGHSYMLERAGASRVMAVEANRDAYLKCLVVKELLGLSHCSFLCGDAVEYLRSTDDDFDVCWCSGILYHMAEPVQLLELISLRAPRLYMWTHYYDAAKLSDGQDKSKAFAGGQTAAGHHQGFTYELHRHRYGAATRLRGFWGGTEPYSNWLTLDDLLAALDHFGWDKIQTQVDEDHPHGPAVNLVATRS